jgi:hypothetical protein
MVAAETTNSMTVSAASVRPVHPLHRSFAPSQLADRDSPVDPPDGAADPVGAAGAAAPVGEAVVGTLRCPVLRWPLRGGGFSGRV